MSASLTAATPRPGGKRPLSSPPRSTPKSQPLKKRPRGAGSPGAFAEAKSLSPARSLASSAGKPRVSPACPWSNRPEEPCSEPRLGSPEGLPAAPRPNSEGGPVYVPEVESSDEDSGDTAGTIHDRQLTDEDLEYRRGVKRRAAANELLRSYTPGDFLANAGRAGSFKILAEDIADGEDVPGFHAVKAVPLLLAQERVPEHRGAAGRVTLHTPDGCRWVLDKTTIPPGASLKKFWNLGVRRKYPARLDEIPEVD